MLTATAASAQAPHPAKDIGTDCAYANVFIGPGASVGGSATQPTGTAGVTIGQYFAKTFGQGASLSPQFELGVVGPLPGGYPLDGFVTTNLMLAEKIPRRDLYLFLTAGYTRFFATGNAVNFGLGMDFQAGKQERVLRIELRDYFLFTGPQQHVIGLRIAIGHFIAD